MKQFRTRIPPKNRLLVFARVPEMGRVKSRLAREIGEEQALEIYRAMLDDVLEGVGASTGDTEVEILWTGSENVGGSDLRAAFGERRLAMQAGDILGDRLAVAFSERIFFYGAEKVMAIGTDDPTLSREQVDVALSLLDSCEWVVGPAHDGGYYLLGCRGEAYHTSVFRDVAWGTASVFATTVEKIRGLNATVAILPMRRDLDELSDLEAFAADPRNLERRTGALLRTWSLA
jgi:rSAM/selenodomain-associated transferase 1